MSTSENEFSESSNVESPRSHLESPYNSPSQQVPHLTNVFSNISCTDQMFNQSDNNLGKKPFLRIIEQPQNYFRFRYRSEMVGTHGCLLGKTTSTSKTKSHPTVELMNHPAKALIRCRLSAADKDEEHPHKLLEDEQEDRDVSAMVPENNSYKVGFAGMGIIHTAKKDVPGLLFKKYAERLKYVSAKELRSRCENMAKTINLNIVRLRFSAHDLVTDQEICPPVFSEPIHNMKSAATNDVKICRISRLYGRPRGGDDVFILVEKVNKKNVVIRFFELDPNGREVWTANGNFLQSDVHHQYAIVFRTPPYRNLQITKDVKVFIELVRPSDGRTSEPKEFVYKAEQIFKQNKRRRVNSTFSSMESSSGGSIKSLSEVPVTVEMVSQDNSDGGELDNMPKFSINIPVLPQPTSPSNNVLADALYYNTASDLSLHNSQPGSSPMLGQPNIPEPPNIQLNSTEFEQLINHNTHIPSEERKRFCETDWAEYMLSFGEEALSEKHLNSMDFIRASMNLASDSQKQRQSIKQEPMSPVHKPSEPQCDTKKTNILDKTKQNNDYTACYKMEDGVEVKKLVKEICDLIANKNGYKKQVVRNKLERLFEIKLSNGDSFLHMSVCGNQPSTELIVKLVHSVEMTHLLNLVNDDHQTILHLAVINEMARLVSFLISKGCNPMITDNEGNNALHYAVVCDCCLEPFLKAIKVTKVPFDIDAYTFEKQTALHLAANYNSERSARLLLQHGADFSSRDGEGRTPLHLAAYDDFYSVAKALLDFVPTSEIDAVDGRGNTALQIVCEAAMRENTLQIAKLLLEKKANPLQHESHNLPAWKLAKDKPVLWQLVKRYMPASGAGPSLSSPMSIDNIKSEPEDDFQSADESVNQNRPRV